ncbi:MAG: biopolymer transporter ExbD [Ideonella sp. WA131b]|jgi:biopolymer transport protein TolR|nr:biopolymer transporter ExbD [Ideonella sp. WA131b]
MAFGRLTRREPSTASKGPMSDINMTPLIDVMLVLLVIFIVTAPLLASRLQLELPASDAAAGGGSSPVLAVSIDAQGRVFLGDEALPEAALRSRLEAAARAAVARDPATELQLRADRAVPYGRVAELIGWVQGAGLVRIGLVTDRPTEASPR